MLMLSEKHVAGLLCGFVELFSVVSTSFVENAQGNKCYEFRSGSKTFDDAKTDCTSSRGVLPELETPEDKTFFNALLDGDKRHIWLGGKSTAGGSINWISGRTFVPSLLEWKTSSPSVDNDCLYMSRWDSGSAIFFNHSWSDCDGCAEKRSVLCEHQCDELHNATEYTPENIPVVRFEAERKTDWFVVSVTLGVCLLSFVLFCAQVVTIIWIMLGEKSCREPKESKGMKTTEKPPKPSTSQ